MSCSLAETTTPEGIRVVLTEARLGHILLGHENLAGHVDDILATVADPLTRDDDETSRSRALLQPDRGPQRWLVVVVEFTSAPAFVVTAFADDDGPET